VPPNSFEPGTPPLSVHNMPAPAHAMQLSAVRRLAPYPLRVSGGFILFILFVMSGMTGSLYQWEWV
jgi:hypothetical protein